MYKKRSAIDDILARTIENFFSSMVFPLVLCLSYGLYFFFRALDYSFASSLIFTVALLMLTFFVCEYFYPYRKKWKPTINDNSVNFGFLLFGHGLVEHMMMAFFASGVAYFFNANSLNILSDFWPKHWPLWSQLVLIVLTLSFTKYWLHRFMHTYAFLWRIHAVHHSLERMNFLASGRLHPVETAAFFVIEKGLILLFIDDFDLFNVYLLLHLTLSLLQHSNIRQNNTWWKYIFVMPEAHYFHHSKNIKESNANYGTILMLWDYLFGTAFLPEDNKEVKQLGLDYPSYPKGFLGLLAAPFKKRYYE